MTKRTKAAVEVITQAAALIYIPTQQHTDSDRITPEGIGVFFYPGKMAVAGVTAASIPFGNNPGETLPLIDF